MITTPRGSTTTSARGFPSHVVGTNRAGSPARSGSPLTIPALVAVICLAGAFAALVRTAQRRRADR